MMTTYVYFSRLIKGEGKEGDEAWTKKKKKPGNERNQEGRKVI